MDDDDPFPLERERLYRCADPPQGAETLSIAWSREAAARLTKPPEKAINGAPSHASCLVAQGNNAPQTDCWGHRGCQLGTSKEFGDTMEGFNAGNIVRSPSSHCTPPVPQSLVIS